MKKRVLAILLCACMAMTGFVRAFAESETSGDANGDGSVTVSDASLVLRYCVGLDYRMSMRNRMFADVNCDGTLEADDAAQILRSIAGLNNLQISETDASLLSLLNKQSTLDDDLTEWAARYIQALPAGNVRKVLYAGAKYIGRSYSEMDCSTFVKMAYRDAGISTSVYTGSSSDGILNWFRTNHPEQLHETDEYSWKDWKPGSVLIYINDDTGKGSHLALYVGEIDGEPIVMESRGRNNVINGVRIGVVMGSSSSWDLCYYVDPLG
jgi:cell wall-associated NlpC family hydrolase